MVWYKRSKVISEEGTEEPLLPSSFIRLRVLAEIDKGLELYHALEYDISMPSR
jgi:hypothetical protein